MYEGSEKLNDLNSVSNYRHEALWNSVPSSWQSGTSSKYTTVFFLSRKSWKYQIEREYGQIKKGRRCNEKKWKKRYSERRKV